VIMGTGLLQPGRKIEVTGADGKTQVVEGKHIIIATDARSRALPNLPQDGKKIIGYREAMVLPEQPKSMVVVGSGASERREARASKPMGKLAFLDKAVPVKSGVQLRR